MFPYVCFRALLTSAKTVLEVDKTRKLYFEEEHMAHDARGKAHDVEEKLKKKKGGIFSSISSLQKKNDKVANSNVIRRQLVQARD